MISHHGTFEYAANMAQVYNQLPAVKSWIFIHCTDVVFKQSSGWDGWFGARHVSAQQKLHDRLEAAAKLSSLIVPRVQAG